MGLPFIAACNARWGRRLLAFTTHYIKSAINVPFLGQGHDAAIWRGPFPLILISMLLLEDESFGLARQRAFFPLRRRTPTVALGRLGRLHIAGKEKAALSVVIFEWIHAV